MLWEQRRIATEINKISIKNNSVFVSLTQIGKRMSTNTRSPKYHERYEYDISFYSNGDLSKEIIDKIEGE